MSDLRTPIQWLEEPEYKGIIVMDPDGWRHNDGVTWDTPITQGDFAMRLFESTIQFLK